MGHTGATDGFNQGFFDDTVFDVEGQFTGALLRSAPADAVGQTGNLGDFLHFDPFAFFGDRRRTVMRALSDRTHLFYFVGIGRHNSLFLSQSKISP